ncbi:MAG: methyltransferase domain-containing protein [Hyphomonas sp.]|nr:methyltransferase domain-containing protein [Hyphomonas sp.]
MKHAILLATASLLLAACANPAPDSSRPTIVEHEAPTFDYDSVFVHDGRPESDFEQYELRHSRAILEFTGVMPGMTVLDMEAGNGIYTELFSLVVGEAGKVYLQNPPEFETFLGDAVEQRMDGRLINVTHIQTSFDDFEPIGDAEVDLVTWFLGPHELWYTPDGSEPGALGDPETAFSEIARILKPGGHFVVIDHRAPDGAPPTTGGDTHRLAQDALMKLVEGVGLVLVSESDLLANPDDDGTRNVFDPSIRRQTDRYILKFVKS